MILELQHRRPDGDIDTYHLKPGRRYHLGRGSGCEVRILDLKLSRKHAAIEFQDQAWTLIDLCSTNGCRLNGETMIGTAPLMTGSTIEIGQTALVIGELIDRDNSGAAAPQLAAAPSAASHMQAHATGASPVIPKLPVPSPDANYASDVFNPISHTPRSNKALSALQPTPVNPAPSDRHHSSETLRPAPAPVFNGKEDSSSVIAKTPPVSPEPVFSEPVFSEPVFSEPAPVAPRRNSDRARDVIKPVTISPVIISPVTISPVVVEPVVVDLAATVSTLPVPNKSTPPPFVQPKIPTPLPSAPQISPAAIPAAALASGNVMATGAGNVANSDERSYFITVLGRRIGPLSRAIARDLKARELKGTLRPTDLDPYPQA